MKNTGKYTFFLMTAMALSVGTSCIAQVNALPIEKVDNSMRTSARPVLILLTTDWCKYCQLQKEQLRKNKDFKAKAETFYFVEFNAEQKEDVTFHEHTYGYKSTGISTGIHELAVALSGEKSVSFPAWILLDKDYQVLFRYNGVLSSQQLKEILNVLDADKHTNQ
jgi:thioredoxin-related protein